MRLMVSQCGQTICKLSDIWLLVGTACQISRLRARNRPGPGTPGGSWRQRILAPVKTVLITGANRGLGLEFARQYGADGWNVVAGCRNPSKAQALQRVSQDMKGRLTLVEIDVTDARSVKGAAAEVGEGAVDVLINCAGVMGKADQTIGTIDYDEWARV